MISAFTRDRLPWQVRVSYQIPGGKMNRLIASLPADARELLETDLHVVQLKKGDVLYRIDKPITHVFFHKEDWSRSLC
jgi:hypothetical protein